ncbi:MAG: hypothetical protein ABEL76_06285 [Bradymonadaceae bacterium]
MSRRDRTDPDWLLAVGRHLRSSPGRAVGWAVAAAGVWFLASLGPRGAPLGILESIGSTPDSFDPFASDALRTAHPLYELIRSVVASAVGANTLSVLALAAGLLVALGLPAVYGLGRALGGQLAGWTALLLFAFAPVVAGAATSAGPAAGLLFVWCWFLRLTTLERARWWTDVFAALAGGALLLLWPPAALWLAAWIVVDWSGARADTAASEGWIGPLELRPSRLVLPVGILAAAALLHPAFWRLELAPWTDFISYVLTRDPGSYLYAGTVYESVRPPLWAGLAHLWWVWPASTALLAAVGWLRLVRRPADSPQLDRTERTLAWLVPFLLLVLWLQRHRSWGQIDVALLAAPVICALAGSVAARAAEGARALLSPTIGRTRASTVATAALVLVVAAPLVGTLRTHPFESTHYNRAYGGLPAAVAAGHPAVRRRLLPIGVASAIPDACGNGPTYAGNWNPALRAYRRAGWLSGIEVTDSASSADCLLRAAGHERPLSDSPPTRGGVVSPEDVRQSRGPPAMPLFFFERHPGVGTHR